MADSAELIKRETNEKEEYEITQEQMEVIKMIEMKGFGNDSTESNDDENIDEEFEATEHIRIGDNVEIQFPGEKKISMLRLPNVVELTFGQIIALAGDFYGVPDAPIIDTEQAKEDDDKKERRFQAAFDTLARRKFDDVNGEIVELLKYFEKEKIYLRKEKKKDLNPKFDKATKEDGRSLWIYIGKTSVPILTGRYMKLALNNTDHFMPYAKHAYMTGHAVALKKAKEAREAKEEKLLLLQEAYALDAFACHFLTDSFASGHMRTPRKELPKATLIGKFGSLSTKYMHDEDNYHGLSVVNGKGQRWKAYGDGKLNSDGDESDEDDDDNTVKMRSNFEMVVEAVQESVNQVFNVFTSEYADDKVTSMDWVFPIVVASESHNPLYKVNGDGKVVRRKDRNDLNCSKYTSKILVTLKLDVKKRKVKQCISCDSSFYPGKKERKNRKK